MLVAPFEGAEDTAVGPLFGLGYGPHVESLTTIATPHFGSVIADAIVKDIPGHKQAVKALMWSLDLITALIRGDQQDTDRAAKALTREFMLNDFNRIIKDDPNVRYYAVAGDPVCRDVVHPWLRPEYKDIRRLDPAEGGGPNDGLVTVTELDTALENQLDVLIGTNGPVKLNTRDVQAIENHLRSRSDAPVGLVSQETQLRVVVDNPLIIELTHWVDEQSC